LNKKKIVNTDLNKMAAVLAGLKGEGARRAFLGAMLTPPERARIALRWRLVCLLAAGRPQREIAGRLGISLCKITRGSKELRKKAVFRKIVTDSIKKGKP
jgi:TrpR family transcriptional regulator, trp operon repressor